MKTRLPALVMAILLCLTGVLTVGCGKGTPKTGQLRLKVTMPGTKGLVQDVATLGVQCSTTNGDRTYWWTKETPLTPGQTALVLDNVGTGTLSLWVYGMDGRGVRIMDTLGRVPAVVTEGQATTIEIHMVPKDFPVPVDIDCSDAFDTIQQMGGTLVLHRMIGTSGSLGCNLDLDPVTKHATGEMYVRYGTMVCTVQVHPAGGASMKTLPPALVDITGSADTVRFKVSGGLLP